MGIYFLKDQQLATVSMDGAGNPTGRDRVLFTVPTYQDARMAVRSFAIMPDGKHFVFLMGEVTSASTHYNVVLNWLDELKQRVPLK
jgi:hypothetical protein